MLSGAYRAFGNSCVGDCAPVCAGEMRAVCTGVACVGLCQMGVCTRGMREGCAKGMRQALFSAVILLHESKNDLLSRTTFLTSSL